MDKVLAFLQEARHVQRSERIPPEKLPDAYAGKKTIITQAQAVGAGVSASAMRLRNLHPPKELANRPIGQYVARLWLANTTRQAATSFDEGQKSNLKIQEIDQENIKEEVSLVLRTGKIGQESPMDRLRNVPAGLAAVKMAGSIRRWKRPWSN